MTIKKYTLLILAVLIIVGAVITGTYHLKNPQKKGVQGLLKTTTSSTYIARTLTLHDLALNTTTTENLNIVCADNTEKELENPTVIPCSNLYTSAAPTPKIMIGTTQLNPDNKSTLEFLSSISFKIIDQNSEETKPLTSCVKEKISTISNTVTARDYICTHNERTSFLRLYVSSQNRYPLLWTIVFPTAISNTGSPNLITTVH